MNNVATQSSAYEAPRLPTRRESVRGAVKALGVIARDPNQLDAILDFFFAVNGRTVAKRFHTELAESHEWQALLAEKPRIDEEHVDFTALEALPDGTLGREYVRFLKTNGITPAPFKTAPEVGDAGITYVMLRFRQTHDLWHVLTGYRTDVDGEVMLQAFTYAQTGSAASAMIAALGLVRYPLGKNAVERVRAAHRLGKKIRKLGSLRWERYWEMPLTELRALVGASATDLPVAPPSTH